MKKDIANSMRMLHSVSLQSNIDIVPSVAKANKEYASVGLGLMGLHGYLAKNKIMYESNEALEFVRVFASLMNYYSLLESMNIAKDTGFIFKGFKGSEYETGEYFDRYSGEEYIPTSEKIKKLFDGFELPTKEDWYQLKKDVKENGLANQFRQAYAPTGNISYVQGQTASMSPITERIENRKYGDSDTFYPMPYMSKENYFYYKESYDMDMYKVIDLYAEANKFTDQGISCTLYVKDTITTRELSMLLMYAWKKKLRTLYYIRSKKTSIEECITCSV